MGDHIGKNKDGATWHAQELVEVIRSVGSDVTRGLGSKEAARRLEQNGPNALPQVSETSLLTVFLRQFTSPLIFILLMAAAIAAYLNEWKDAAVILFVVVLNAVIGTYQEGRAARSLEALRRLAMLYVRVWREGQEMVITAKDLVPGDMVMVVAGDAVPADARLVDSQSLEAAESALTGESLPVGKSSTVLVAKDTPLADRSNMIYAGTFISSGRAKALVVATGRDTEVGHLAMQTAEAQEVKSPLERRIRQFSHYVIIAAIILFVVILLAGITRDLPLARVFMIGISQMVSMVPEGLPIAMTVALAIGVQRMAKRGVIIRRLSAVEALGSTTVICSDKTGTLTRNEMTVTRIYTARDQRIDVTGVGYAPEGRLEREGRVIPQTEDPDLAPLLAAAVLCNDANLVPPDDQDQRWRPIGDPTEAALLTLAMKAGVNPKALTEAHPRKSEIPFDSAAKLMAIAHEQDGLDRIYLKGAPEMVVAKCAQVGSGAGFLELDDRAATAILTRAHDMASEALRVLAFAVIEGEPLDPSQGFEGLRRRANFLGLIGQMDPPRDEARTAVLTCQRASIRPIMITGDHKATGVAVAKSLGIYRPGDDAVDGVELSRLSDQELLRQVETTSVFARVHPSQKQRIVLALQKKGHVVAMTGDGVNDAPALASADVGVAMGITGTEVAKEAAKIIITDDNFATIVAGIEEGRLVHRNIKKVVLYLLATSTAEVLTLLVAIMAGYPLPLAAVQILWINLVTEGSVTVNLIMEPLEGDELSQPPPPPHEPLLTRDILLRMALMTPIMASVTLGWFIWRLGQDIPFALVQTETFTLLAVCQWFNVLNCRSGLQSALTLDVMRNKWLLGGLLLSNLLHGAVVYWPPLQGLFHTVPISPREFLAIGGLGSFVLWAEEMRKWVARRRIRALASQDPEFARC